MVGIKQKAATILIYFEMIKIQHSIFALPFAMVGMVWGAGGWPGWRIFAWIVVAMISCRSSAMAFNRIADRKIDALNPRTAVRAIPIGLLSLNETTLFFALSCLIFILSAYMLNPLAFALSPVALFITLFYSYTKRFTSLSHFVLGLSLGIAPVAAWIGSCGSLGIAILPLALAVLFWSAGFDIIYSLQDEEFDKNHNLCSLPASLGKRRALLVSRLSHTLSIFCLVCAGVLNNGGGAYFLGVIFAGILLFYEHCLVKPNDLSKVNIAFFTLNGYVSIGFFLFTLVDFIFN